jgi:hypothetical protein
VSTCQAIDLGTQGDTETTVYGVVRGAAPRRAALHCLAVAAHAQGQRFAFIPTSYVLAFLTAQPTFILLLAFLVILPTIIIIPRQSPTLTSQTLLHS